ncbi:MAG: ATP synthase F0 subunit B [Nitrospinae bacterium]|nr:ATP synthase F0 subunit B [Nitrospinota bacterium]
MEGLALNYTFVLQLAIFFGAMFILNQWLFKPVSHLLERREHAISGTWKEVEAKQTLLEERLTQYNAIIDQARREMAERITSVRKDAEGDQRRIIEKAREEASSLLQAAMARIQQEGEEAKRSLRRQTEQLSLVIAEKLLGRAIF